MTKPNDLHESNTAHIPPPKNDEVKQEKQKAEQEEVIGRHKNDGRNDHVGHKVVK
ncbi:hypothetical protein RCH09_002988 [Actimicrobium sp. GrIS 1.19]|uniref:hypothetical protein n=1 Tax=Actimicrobium sp. GrIS 1.19 TaxID=3071708 RepID=UPI002DFBBA07|nr:hypothetical protein [Actimicrobium sp. GrIS 1.19]